MIKHEEAMVDLREIAENITSKQWLKLTLKIFRITNYIAEQEKKDELLGLYRELHETQDMVTYENVLEQIKALEEKMK